jgi:uncharacterized protein (DUF885 family)
MPKQLTTLLLFAMLAACGGTEPDSTKTPNAQDGSTVSASATPQNFDDVIAGITRDWLRQAPEEATMLGVSEDVAGGPYLSRLAETGVAARAERYRLIEDFVNRLNAVNPDALEDSERLSREMLLDRYGLMLEIRDLAGYGRPLLSAYGPVFEVYPANQFSAPYLEFPSLMQNAHPVTNADQAEAYIARLVAIESFLAGIEELVLADADAGAVPPDFVIRKTVNVLQNLVSSEPEANSLYTNFAERLEANNVDNADALKERALKALREHAYPAHLSLAETMQGLLTNSSQDAGMGRLPNGEALYEAMIRLNADLPLGADEIHQIGLDNVARITTEIDAIFAAEGITDGTVGERLKNLLSDPNMVYPDTDAGRQALLTDVRDLVAEISALAPQYFNTLPEADVEVRAIPAFREATSSMGYYDAPLEDGSRPGIYWINLRDPASVPKFYIPTLSYHEAVPGHHFQIALGFERKELPIVHRVNSITNAFAEGWALYAEGFAEEMGVYEGKPFSDIGRLRDELHRAIRLVTDTGMHAKGWSREDAIDYMSTVEGLPDGVVISEIERYAAKPGQALGYMIGMLKIRELRAEAEAALGDRFEIGAFHDAVLTKGGLPLLLLQRDVRAWIAE